MTEDNSSDSLPVATRRVPLAKLTTLGVGGVVGALVTPLTERETVDTVREVASFGAPLHVIGGGSNILASDDPLPGVALQSADYTIDVSVDREHVELRVGAGVEWDELVAYCVAERFAGIECLSGIPGKVGAAPIQNIGAYGQEVSSVVTSVRTIDRATGAVEDVPAADCAFGYRDSRFKREWRDQRVVASVVLRLARGGAPHVGYPELERRVAAASGAPTLASVRDAVLALRRSKSMVLDPADPNTRSAGSFFMNPVVADTDAVVEAARAAGVDAAKMPQYDAPGGTKLSAAWLIEHAGFEKGYSFGAAGLSTRHCLALVNRGGAKARDLIALASVVRRGVRNAFGITLVPEPVFLGFDATVDELLG